MGTVIQLIWNLAFLTLKNHIASLSTCIKKRERTVCVFPRELSGTETPRFT